MYSYCSFGLNIVSDLEFPELLPALFDQTDVTILIGNVVLPGHGRTIIWGDYTIELHEKEVYFDVKGIATYMARDGEKIWVHVSAGQKDHRTIRIYILGTIMAAILLQRKRLPLHASAILMKGEVMLISGDSGAGKSSTLSGLVKRGCKVFSDDIVVIDSEGLACASYPMIKLWEDTQEKLNDQAFAGKSFEIREDMKKFGVFFHDEFDTGHYPVKKIIVLKKGVGNRIEHRMLRSSNAFDEIRKQVYRPAFAHTNEQRAFMFTMLSKLTNFCELYEVTRPEPCDIDELSAYVNDLLSA